MTSLYELHLDLGDGFSLSTSDADEHGGLGWMIQPDNDDDPWLVDFIGQPSLLDILASVRQAWLRGDVPAWITSDDRDRLQPIIERLVGFCIFGAHQS